MKTVAEMRHGLGNCGGGAGAGIAICVDRSPAGRAVLTWTRASGTGILW